MTKTSLMQKLAMVAVLVLFFTVQVLAEDAKSGGDQGGGVTVTIMNPKTGETKTGTIPLGDEQQLDAGIRKMLGMPSKSQEDAAGGRQQLTIEQIKAGWTKRCLHVGRHNTRGFIDAEGKLWNGISYDGGILPVLGESNGFVKSVTRRPEGGGYEVAYFRRADLVEDFHQTDWFQTAEYEPVSTAGYEMIEAEVPDLCPNPAIVKK